MMTMKISTTTPNSSTPPNSPPPPSKVDILILGAGWTSTFLIPLLKTLNITQASTTTTGRDSTIPFIFSPTDPSPTPYLALPAAKTVLITFPLLGVGASSHLVNLYKQTHPHPSTSDQQPSEREKEGEYQFIQLGSTGIWSLPSSNQEKEKESDIWVTRHSKYDATNPRAIAEDELLTLNGCVINLSGLWGDTRHPKHWLERVASTKEMIKSKGSLHLIHGLDVARAVVAVHGRWESGRGERFMLTDTTVYDWWQLIVAFAGQAEEEEPDPDREGNGKYEKQMRWVGELMNESQGDTEVRALPRSMELLGRCYDTREFWRLFGIMPSRFLI